MFCFENTQFQENVCEYILCPIHTLPLLILLLPVVSWEEHALALLTAIGMQKLEGIVSALNLQKECFLQNPWTKLFQVSFDRHQIQMIHSF